MEIRLEGVPMWFFLLFAGLGMLCATAIFVVLIWVILIFMGKEDALARLSERHERPTAPLPATTASTTAKPEDASEAFWRREIDGLHH